MTVFVRELISFLNVSFTQLNKTLSSVPKKCHSNIWQPSQFELLFTIGAALCRPPCCRRGGTEVRGAAQQETWTGLKGEAKAEAPLSCVLFSVQQGATLLT